MQEIDIRFPSNVVIETTAHCQLNCTMCARSETKRKLGNMKPELVRFILEQIADWNKESIRVWYCFLGEPLLIRNRLMDYIQYGRSLGIRHHIINTNGHLLDPPTAEQLIDAGLTEIYIGIDAISSEMYKKIRVGGDFDRVVQNVHHLLKIKPDHLQVTIQMIELAENRHARDAFIRYWKHRNARVFIKKELTWTGHLDKTSQRMYPPQRYPCPWILDTFGIYWNGDIPYCVNDWNGVTVYGNIRKRPIKALWEEQINLFARPHILNIWDGLPKTCMMCDDWAGKDERKIVHSDEIIVGDEVYV